MQTLYQIALTTHIIGLSTMAGTTLASYILTKQFWNQYVSDRSKATAIHEAGSKFSILFGIGIVLLILSGIAMMAITQGAFGEQLWFRIKFGMIIGVIINGLAVGRTQGSRLTKILSEEVPETNSKGRLLRIKSNIRWFHISQMIFFFVIFTLSVFKFN
jgi:uncharacterized membrane protein SirB2